MTYETESFSSDADTNSSIKTLKSESRKVNLKKVPESSEPAKKASVIKQMSGKISKKIDTFKQRHIL